MNIKIVFDFHDVFVNAHDAWVSAFKESTNDLSVVSDYENKISKKEICKKYNLDYPYPPINLSMSFDLSKSTYNEKQNAIIYKDGVDNNEAINSWIKYNIIAISEQLYYLDERLNEYSDMFTNDEKIK